MIKTKALNTFTFRFVFFIVGIVFFPLSLISFTLQAGTPITICTDSNFWYPFTYVKEDNKQASGLHIDIITQALKNLGYEPNYKPMPWQQCLKEGKTGLVDAVATVSYKKDRALYLDYPSDAMDAESGAKSKERVTQVEYRVITSRKDEKGQPNNYRFQGDVKTIPAPVRIASGYSIVDTLELAGLKVEENPHSIDNFKKLIKEKRGSVIDLEDVTKHLGMQPEYNGKMIISDQPIFSKSYFLAFSKDGKIKQDAQKKIWAEIAKVRENSSQMTQFLEKY